MSQLNNLFQLQKNALESQGHQEASAVAKDLFIHFETSSGDYAVPITAVREIVDSQPITPYPESIKNHIGIISLRGQVLPVILPLFNDTESVNPKVYSDLSTWKILVMEFTSGEVFCILASQVHKVFVEHGQGEAGSVISIKGKPARIVAEADFFNDREAA